MGLEELVSGTIPPRADRCAQKSSLAARCIYVKLGLLPQVPQTAREPASADRPTSSPYSPSDLQPGVTSNPGTL